TPRDGLSHPVQRDEIIGPVGNAHLGQRQGLSRFSRRRARSLADPALAGGLYVRLDDAAARTGALNSLKVEPGLLGQASRQRRGEDALTVSAPSAPRLRRAGPLSRRRG